jgi:transcriptional regulator with XRE-family HTH domain
MATNLCAWRKRNNLSQVDAAALLGVSQPYLSLLEKGVRPLNRQLRERLDAVRSHRGRPSTDDRFRAQLSALGYPGFAHIDPVRPVPKAGIVLLDALSQPTLDARVAEALPWLTSHCADHLDWPWLVRHAKLRNLQNRLGFLLELATADNNASQQDSAMNQAKEELDKARLLAEATFCWDSMPAATRKWMREQRSAEAAHWNIVTRMRSAGFSEARDDAK